MKTQPLGKILTSILIFVGSSVAVLAATAAPQVVSLGNNTYSISYQASNAFKRDTDEMKSNLEKEATDYCAAQGRHLKIVSLDSKRPIFGMGYANAKIVFKALAAGETDSPVAAPGESAPPVVAAPPPLTTTELYDDLTKLDDLRKKGILSDEEFQAEKRKLLSRSN